jgi:hypothetical protein
VTGDVVASAETAEPMAGRATATPAVATGPDEWSRREVVISGFILFHIIALVLWCFGLERPRTRVGKGLDVYMVYSGLSQGWAMFAPNPTSLNSHVEAEITYQNGRVRVWRFPRPEEIGYFERMFTERFRKWANDRLRMDANAALWPDAARYIARLNDDPTNRPVTVALVRYWSQIGPPGSKQPEPWQHTTFFTYTVTPADLR